MTQDSQSKSKDQFMLRLPDGMRVRIAENAKQNNRSMNAEIVERLESSLVSSATDRLLSILRDIRLGSGKRLDASHLAYAIGEKSPTLVENVLTGAVVPHFGLLESIGTYLHVNLNWLIHGGDGYSLPESPFIVHVEYDYGPKFADYLIGDDSESVHFIRSDDKEGRVAIVREIDDYKAETLFTLISMGDQVTSTNERYLIDFHSSCKKMWENDRSKFQSFILDPHQFDLLVRGQLYPMTAISNAQRASWFDDWWDEKMFNIRNKEDEYWIGYGALCNRIHAAVESKRNQNLENVESINNA